MRYSYSFRQNSSVPAFLSVVLFVYSLFILITSGGVCKGLIAFALKTPLIKESQRFG